MRSRAVRLLVTCYAGQVWRIPTYWLDEVQVPYEGAAVTPYEALARALPALGSLSLL
jgi:hypothetical protein